MDTSLITILELALFFILFVFNLQLFNSLRFEEMFKKGHIKQIQVLYIFSVIIFTYLLTKALMNLITLTYNLT
jgi:uncharacterized membrane protein YwzB